MDKSTGVCAIEDCERPVRRRDLCKTHYERFLRTGVRGGPIQEHMKQPDECLVHGCGGKAVNRGWCSKHYQRASRHGNPTGEYTPEYTKTCTFPGCDNPRRYKDMCMGHYAQILRGHKIGPLRALTDATIRDGEGRKKCRRCSEWLPESQFSVNMARPDSLGAYCKPCERDKGLIIKFGIGQAQFDAMLEDQDGGCAICGATSSSGGRGLVVDHDHSCCPSDLKTCGNCIRGILCVDCNAGLGMFADLPERMDRAAEYVRSNARVAQATG